jgi:hypothetical protein
MFDCDLSIPRVSISDWQLTGNLDIRLDAVKDRVLRSIYLASVEAKRVTAILDWHLQKFRVNSYVIEFCRAKRHPIIIIIAQRIKT